ncbi:MAG TPA: 50S ribosomal protein L24 [Cytophagaceae bacterium]|jgi:large subunit ribosomal protein L24|nr:50S ribosomal protein L24 [Cytophagaceae bacterium]
MEKKNKVTKLHIRKGDTVIVIAGDSKGKEGKVSKVLVSENKAIVEGLNMVKRHLKPTATKPQGSIVEKEAPIHVSNLQLKDPKNGKATKVGRKLDSNKKLVRYSKKTGEVIKNG